MNVLYNLQQPWLTQQTMGISVSKIEPSHNNNLDHPGGDRPPVEWIVQFASLAEDPYHETEIIAIGYGHPHTFGVAPHSNTFEAVATAWVDGTTINHSRATVQINRDVPALRSGPSPNSSYTNPVNYIQVSGDVDIVDIHGGTVICHKVEIFSWSTVNLIAQGDPLWSTITQLGQVGFRHQNRNSH